LVIVSESIRQVSPTEKFTAAARPAWRIWPNGFIFRLLTSDAQPHLFGGVEILRLHNCWQLGHQRKRKSKIGLLGGDVLEIRRQRSVNHLHCDVYGTVLIYCISIFS
jgi:hypothetical protein